MSASDIKNISRPFYYFFKLKQQQQQQQQQRLPFSQDMREESGFTQLLMKDNTGWSGNPYLGQI